MGDRANVKVVDVPSTVYLYTHWAGTELPATLERALARKARWDDGQYLARIIFQEMLSGDESELGYGISSTVGDGDDRILVVDVGRQVVYRADESGYADKAQGEPIPFAAYSADSVTDW
jgi:hypothetical protein